MGARTFSALAAACLLCTATARADSVTLAPVDLGDAIIASETATSAQSRPAERRSTSGVRAPGSPDPLNLPVGPSVTPFATTDRPASAIMPPKPPQSGVSAGAVRVFPLRLISALKLGEMSPIAEPAVASLGGNLLVTYNWFAALSRDGGTTFSGRDPYTIFDDNIAGNAQLYDAQARRNRFEGFCCDQIAVAIPNSGVIAWFMQGLTGDQPPGTGDHRPGNRIRLATIPQDANQRMRFFDFTSALAGVPSCPTCWLDYPDTAVSTNHLYVSYNVFERTWSKDTQGNYIYDAQGRAEFSDMFRGAAVFRIALADLRAGRNRWQPWFADSANSVKFARGARDAMFWAALGATADSLQSWFWRDNDTAASHRVPIPVEPWDFRTSQTTADCLTPDGRSWLIRPGNRVTGGWHAGRHVGFAWVAGADQRFDCPHVRVAIVFSSSLLAAQPLQNVHPVAQPHVWSERFSMSHLAAQPNSDGVVGVSLVFGGEGQWPSPVVGYLDEVAQTGQPTDYKWRLRLVETGTNTLVGCTINANHCGRWGDYFVVAQDGEDPRRWLTTTLLLQNDEEQPYEPRVRLVRFQR
jgi:hypothetical protein